MRSPRAMFSWPASPGKSGHLKQNENTGSAKDQSECQREKNSNFSHSIFRTEVGGRNATFMTGFPLEQFKRCGTIPDMRRY